MSEDAEPETTVIARRRRSLWLRGIGWLIAGLLGVVAVALLGIDTSPGHRLIVERIADLKIKTGLRIRIGRIDGSIWHHTVLRDVRLYDLQGQFFEAPEIDLRWRPLAWLDNRLAIDRITSDLVTLKRLPHLRSTPGAPILPGFDIRIGKLDVTHMRLGKAVAGSTAIARLSGQADVHGKRAMIKLTLASDKGDKLLLDMDAMPDGDRFRLAGKLDSPAGGAIGGAFGTKRPIAASIGGSGGWHVWDGHGSATVSGKPVADLALTARDGRFALRGMLAPSPYLNGKLQRLTTPKIGVAGEATLANRMIDGRIGLASPELRLGAKGRIDLAQSAFSNLRIDLGLLEPRALFPNMTGRDVHLHVLLDGPFRTARYRYALNTPHIAFDATGFDTVKATGAGQITPLPLALPIKLSAARVTGIGAVAGGILANLSIDGLLRVDAKAISGTGLALSSDKLRGKLGLHVDLVTGKFDVALAGGLQRYLIPGLGIVDVDTELSVTPGANGLGAIVAGHGTADVRRFDNAFLRSLVGGLPHLRTKLVRNQDQSLTFTNLVLTGPAIRITGTGLRRRDGSFKFDGTGTQAIYGPFRLALDGMIDHPKINLLFDHPVTALGLRAVQLDLDPVPQGFLFRASGSSYIGPFTANGTILTPPGGTTAIQVASLAVSGTKASGTLDALPAGLSGELRLAGGGIGGSILVSPQANLQKIEPHLTFAAATIAAETPIVIRRGRADGTVLLDPAGTRLDLTAQLGGLARGKLQLARLALRTHLVGGSGTIGITAAGGKAKSFVITADAQIAPGRVTVAAKGDVDGQAVTLNSPAEITAEADGWRLAPVSLAYGGGSATVGALIGDTRTALDIALDRLPLALLDVVSPYAQLAGTASGRLLLGGGPGQPPTGKADLTIRGLSRSGLVLASEPIDLGFTGVLTVDGAAMRAVAASSGKTIGRAQLRISPLTRGGDLMTRIGSAPLFAQLRYGGPGDILWRLLGIRTLDLSGPISIGADVSGTLDNPAIRGSVGTSAGRIESAVTGTIVQNIQANGRFDGRKLVLDRMAGTTPNGGSLTGHGAFDLSLGAGVGIDLALQADGAQMLNRDDIAATVTGPITIRSDGREGTIAGNLSITKSRYKLGAAASAQVGQLKVIELNRTDDDDMQGPPPTPWQLDVHAKAPSRLMVTGLGLDSEWRADLTIKGAVNNPAIGGRADLIRGGYQFAGRRFDLTRGVIRFTGDAPPDPILDITAGANIQGLSASIRVTGTGLHPEIGFESVPALPEDELLSRLLFGTSITNLSAPEALQLASAVAALRNQGGKGLNLDPINAVRRAVHLDRLRVLPADVTTGQKTSIAAGKNIGRRTYVEVITDGAGYSATSVEFRITRWLSLLSTISTVGRQSANLRVSKDY